MTTQSAFFTLQCMTAWCIRSLRKYVKECAYSVNIKQSFKLLRTWTATENSFMWYLRLSFLYSSVANCHFQTSFNPHLVPEFLTLFLYNCIQSYMTYYQKWVKCESWSKISVKSLMPYLKCHQTNTNFQHKDGLSHHNRAMDIKATCQISGIFPSVTSCSNKSCIFLVQEDFKELLGNTQLKKEHFCKSVHTCGWPVFLHSS